MPNSENDSSGSTLHDSDAPVDVSIAGTAGSEGDRGSSPPADSEQKPAVDTPPEEDPRAETEEGDAAESPADDAAAAPLTAVNMRWYVLRVASNREEKVCEALKKKVSIEHLDGRIGRILVLTRREKRMRSGVARVFERKLYPGYIFVEMETADDGTVPDEVWYVIKDTMGVGDFIGSDGKPSPMKTHDVEQMLGVVEKAADQPTLAGMAGMKKGDAIKVKEGPFENFEGEIDEVYPDKGQVRVIVTIFGRATPIELEYWQIEVT